MASTNVRIVVVVGGGFCGTLVAVNLLRSPNAALRVVLIERAQAIGRGMAFARRDCPYLLNVPAGRMSATTGAPSEFLEFAQERLPDATADDFLPRELYGDYLRHLLDRAQSFASDVALERWTADVTTVRRIGESAKWMIVTEDGRTLIADDVVLAIGTPTGGTQIGGDQVITTEVATHPAYVAEPYSAGLTSKYIGRVDQQVLLIGSSLTMADAVTSIDRTDRTARFCAISRHGLLPPEQTTFKPPVFSETIESSLRLAAAFSLRKLTRTVRNLSAEAERRGGDWREAITMVRNSAPSIWRSLSPDDRERFLRHLQTYWNVHRHRLPTAVRSRLDELRSNGRLEVRAGRIRRIVSRDDRLEVHWQARGSNALYSQLFDRVINCSGQNYRVLQTTDLLWRSLINSRLCAVDELETGIRVSSSGALIDSEGLTVPNLFYVGALLRANHWESTAVAELRVHCERLAEFLTRLRTPTFHGRPTTENRAQLR